MVDGCSGLWEEVGKNLEGGLCVCLRWELKELREHGGIATENSVIIS